MNKYIIQTENLNNSLAFYHALFQKMPDKMDSGSLNYTIQNVQLEVIEVKKVTSIQEAMVWEVSDQQQLYEISKRMDRFRMKAKIQENCEVLQNAFGMLDPDSNKWIIGDSTIQVEFEKCYINNEQLNTI